MQGRAEDDYSVFDVDSSILIANFSDGCPSLQYLNISWCDNIQDKGVQMVLAGCKSLTTLIMKGCEGVGERRA